MTDGTVDLQTMVTDKVRASGSSFFWAMRLLERDRRQAMYAVYAFCRDVDDIVDEPGVDSEKYARLNEWRADIAALYEGHAPKQLLAAALVEPIGRYDLQRDDFLAVIDGCAMDVGPGVVRPPMAILDLYCDRVAGAVGRLSVRVFGDFVPEAITVANHQGRALQLTNILRDVVVDAKIGRLYLPDELLSEFGIVGTNLEAILAHPRLPDACRALATVAQSHYDATRAAMRRCSRRAMRPARVMMEMYAEIYRLCEADGWKPRAEPRKVPKWMKIVTALRYGLFA